jgi:succinate dehydrogenase/fumarate reductase iron-sulfur protein
VTALPVVARRHGSVEVRIARSDPTALASFEVQRVAAFVVLDLIACAASEDPTLAYRYSCRSGFCGTCTVLLDGLPVLACQTPIPDVPAVHIAPIGGLPVVRDLVVDPTSFSERWDAVDPVLEPHAHPPGDSLPRPVDVSLGADGSPAGDTLDCISCGACFAACDLAALDRVFLGPAALARALVLVADPRDARRRGRLASVDGPSGIDGCHGIGACSLVCPKDVDPQRAIRRLRRWRMTGAA